MLPLTEQEIQQIEEHLDGALHGSARGEIARRIGDDPLWSAAAQALVEERAMRARVYASAETDETVSADFAEQLIAAVKRAGSDTGVSPVLAARGVGNPVADESSNHQTAHTGGTPVSQLRRSWSIVRLATAAAACIAFGLMTGWALRGNHGAPAISAAGKPTPSSIVAVGSTVPAAKVVPVVSYEVKLTDETGRVTAVQRFDSLKEAREFADDLSNWQKRQRQVREGAAVLISDRY